MSINSDSATTEVDENVELPVPHLGPRKHFKLTVEVPCLLILFGISLTGGVTSNLLLYRTCSVDLGYNASVCDLLNLKNKTNEAKAIEDEVQAKVTVLQMMIVLYGGIVPALLSIFLGSWSDKHGRKPLMLFPSIGLVLTSILCTIYAAIPELSSTWYIACITPFALFGGSTAFSLGASLIVTDLSDENSRAFRLSIVQGCYFIGLVIGTVSSSYVYDAIGYFYIFLATVIIYFVSLIYLIFFVNESLVGAQKPTIRTIINCAALKDMAEVCLRRRDTSVIIMLILLMSAFCLTTININGILTMEYLFTREKFQWLLKDYSIFSAVNLIFIILGLFFGLGFLQKVCRVNDGFLLILSFMSSISDAVLKGLAVMPWQMYFAASTSMLGGLSLPIIRSQVAKMISSDEVGKMFALISCVEAITPIFAPMLFSLLYYKTLSTFPGMIYLVSAILYAICLLFVTIAEVIFYRKRNSPQYVNFETEPEAQSI